MLQMLTGALIALAGVLLGAALVTKAETKKEAEKKLQNTPYNDETAVIVPQWRDNIG